MRIIATHEGVNPPPEWLAGDTPIHVMGRTIVTRRKIRRVGARKWEYVVVTETED